MCSYTEQAMLRSGGTVRNDILTISVDDGSPLDWRSAELLRRYNHRATFYWSRRNPHHEVMSEAMMKAFTWAFPTMDIQNHTFSHALMTRLSLADLKHELWRAFEWHTSLFGRPVGLCAPRGYISHEVGLCASKVGFEYIRTIQHEERLSGAIKAIDGGYHFFEGKLVQRGPTPALWWHSWEVEKHNAWEALEEVLASIPPTISNTEYVSLYC